MRRNRDRLKELVDRLRVVAQKVARTAKASRWSITGGLPKLSVSVTLEWDLDEAE